METNHKFEIFKFSRRTELIVNIQDKDKLITAMNERNFKYTSEDSNTEFKVKIKEYLGKTSLNFLKGRIVPRIKYKPKSTIEPIYDNTIIVGFKGCLATDFEWKYKRLN